MKLLKVGIIILHYIYIYIIYLIYVNFKIILNHLNLVDFKTLPNILYSCICSYVVL
jgi:hypothetical protein